jgi:hypothetical protein
MNKAIIALVLIAVLSVFAVSVASFETRQGAGNVQTQVQSTVENKASAEPVQAEEKISEPSASNSISVSASIVPAAKPSVTADSGSFVLTVDASAENMKNSDTAQGVLSDNSTDEDIEDFYNNLPVLECYVAGSKDCVKVSEEQSKKYDAEAASHPEMVKVWTGHFDDAQQNLKINSDGTYSQLTTGEGQPVNFDAIYAIHGKWRVAGGEIIFRYVQGNCGDFCAKTLKIVGSTLVAPEHPDYIFR